MTIGVPGGTPRGVSGRRILEGDGAGDGILITFESVPRRTIRAGDLVLVRRRDMVLTDLVPLASFNEGGITYVETSSIDGDTNLKLPPPPRRNGPRALELPLLRIDKAARRRDRGGGRGRALRDAVERIALMSLLGRPGGACALTNPANMDPLGRPDLRGGDW